ncbi:unnamed protein product [Lactuca virosa]|uniref:Uncharacterized protein n=1 Tax=Lactuca virosa TaxID=75947 RepID=A0AAU9MXN9_9ASTR|nr:unnamed protein product [Lactuca virosa]
MASDSKLRKYLTVYVHYNGLFAPKPLVYLNAVVVSISDVDFGAMDLKEFKLFVAKLIESSCDNVYYCTRNEPLAEGIRRIGNDADYYEFIETGYSDEAGLTMNVYIDHENEAVLDWADMEVLEDDEGHYYEPDVDDDKDSQLSDDIPYEHEVDGYIPSLDKTVGDEFLHRVSGISKDKNDELETDEVETNNGDDKPVYPIHNENRKWDKMVPILGKVEPVQVDPVQVDPAQVDPVEVNPAPHVEPVDDPAPHVEPVQVDDPVNDVPAQPVATRQRIRKYSERITKIGLRRKVLKKEGNTDHHPMVLE